MEPFRDITNQKKKFSTHIEIGSEYRTTKSLLSTTGQYLTSEKQKNKLRLEKKKCIDLWVDGKLYPKDPLTGSAIPCHNLHSFLHYLGDGEDGLLGYCKRLDLKNDMVAQQLHGKLQHADSLIQLGKQTIDELCHVKQQQELRIQEQSMQLTQKNSEMAELEEDNKKMLDEVCLKNEELSTKIAQMMGNEKLLLKRISNLNRRLSTLKATAICWKAKGAHQPVENLAKGGGALKKRIRATRNFLHEMLGTPENNEMEEGSIVRHIVKKDDMLSILRHPEHQGLRKDALAEVAKDLGNEIEPSKIVHACDASGISRAGYQTMFDLYKKNQKTKIKSILPRPGHVRASRKEATKHVHDIIGGYTCIHDTMAISDASNKINFEYNEKNNIFLDVEKVQAAMIRFYSLSTEGEKIF